jgi:hypothetical protein
MNRRSLFSTIAGIFLGRRVVQAAPTLSKADKQVLLDQMYANLQRNCSDIWDVRPASDFCRGGFISLPRQYQSILKNDSQN